MAWSNAAAQPNQEHDKLLLPRLHRKDRTPTFAPPKGKAMSVTRLKRKNRKDKSVASVRRTSLKTQSFKPVIRNVDVEKIKEEFKARLAEKKK